MGIRHHTDNSREVRESFCRALEHGVSVRLICDPLNDTAEVIKLLFQLYRLRFCIYYRVTRSARSLPVSLISYHLLSLLSAICFAVCLPRSQRRSWHPKLLCNCSEWFLLCHANGGRFEFGAVL